MTRSALLLVVGISFILTSCTQSRLTVKEQAQYQKILDKGLPPMKIKEPALAGALNLLLGAGYFYLEEWGHGFIGLLLFPISWIWGIPGGLTDAHRMNVRYTIAYYKEKIEVEDESK